MLSTREISAAAIQAYNVNSYFVQFLFKLYVFPAAAIQANNVNSHFLLFSTFCKSAAAIQAKNVNSKFSSFALFYEQNKPNKN